MVSNATSIGNAVDLCIKDSTEEWCRANQGYRSREEAMCEDIVSLGANVSRFHGGELTVWVTVMTKQKRGQLQNWYKFRRANGDGYVQIEPTKSKV